MEKDTLGKYVVLTLILMSGVLGYSIYRSINNSSNVSSLKSRIENTNDLVKSLLFSLNDTTNKKELINKVRDLQIEHDYYINQLEIQSDWLILYISLIFAILAIVGFTVSRQAIKDATEKYDENISRHHDLIATHTASFLEFKKDVNERIAANFALPLAFGDNRVSPMNWLRVLVCFGLITAVIDLN